MGKFTLVNFPICFFPKITRILRSEFSQKHFFDLRQISFFSQAKLKSTPFLVDSNFNLI